MNIRSLLNQLRYDIKNNVPYREYEDNANGWQRYYILSRTYSTYVNGHISFEYKNKNSIFSGIIPVEDFVKMTNTEFITYLAEYHYYNTIMLDEVNR